MKEKIQKWLDDRGYSLEMRVAQTLRQKGLSVVQSEFYLDTESKQARETDVVAYQNRSGGGKQFLLAVVVECNLSIDKPWVLFTHANTYSTEVSIQRHAATFYSQAAISKVSMLKEVQNFAMFALPERIGYSLVVALSDQNDRAYAALMAVLSAAKGIVEDLKKRSASQSLHAFSVPIIVVKGKLFESFLDSSGFMKVEEIDKGTLVWRNPVLGVISTVTIVTESAFSGYVDSLSPESEKFADFVLSALEKG